MKTSMEVVVVLLAQWSLCLSVQAQTTLSYVPGLKLSIPPVSGTNLLLNLLEADAAGKYDVYYATNLISATWNDTLQGTNGQTNFILSFPVSQGGFFRAARTDPAVADAGGISFYFLNGFVNSNITLATVEGGPAVATAILVDSTNFARATWIPFSSTPLVDIGTNEGTHEIWFGFRGTNGVVYWTSDTVTLDKTPPAIVITNPIFSTTSRPIIQVQGYSTEPLSSIYFDVTNAAGSITNQQGFVTAQDFDTNNFSSTTNWFQCFDVELTNGVNSIIVHAADLAGNVTTTNVIITLDFTGDTNPPAITVTWPQDGTQISGTNFTLRGVLDDETAQITAQTVDTNGVTNIVSGVVERNGTFWLEDLPLNPGTNLVAVTATDAAGNSSVTNLTLFQSDVTLTINPVPDDQLNQSATTVTGTVSDPSYDVWVNGVQATVDGSGNWTASDVPVYGNGTATFDAIAYPPGQSPNLRARMNASDDESPVQTSLASEQPPTVFVNQYSDQWIDDEGENVSWGASKNYTATLDDSGNLSYQGNGTFFYHYDHVGSGEGWWDTSYNWSSDDPDGTFIKIGDDGDGSGGDSGTGCGDVFNPDPYSAPSVSWCDGNFYLSHYYANINYHLYWGTHYTRSSKTYMKLRTGGKSGVSRQNLFRIGAGATEYGQPYDISWLNAPDYWIYTPMNGIPPNQIRVLGKNLGNDGNLFIVLPDNATLDLGAVAPGRHYSLGVGAGKYKMFIQANGSILRSDRVIPTAKFCAGQQIGFAPVWSPSAPPNVASASYLWDLSTKFVNHSTHPCGSCSVNYDIDLNLLDVAAPAVWYMSGGNKNAYAHVFLHFSNGQSATVDASGQFDMFRPQILGREQVSQGAVKLNTNSLPTVKLGMLAAGTDYIHWTTDVGLDTRFSANLFHVQLVDFESMCDIGLYCISKYNGTSGQYWLDNSYPYDSPWPVNPDKGGNYQTMQGIWFADGPDISGNFCTFAQLTPSFKTYLCFQPTSAGSIPITLERVEWSEHGRADLTSGIWTLTTSYITGPSFSNDDAFPFWEQVFHNTSGN